MQGDKNNNLPLQEEDKVKWKQAIEIFSQVSTWIVGPIIVALILGKYLDGRFDTKPWIFLGLTSFAFIISAFGIIREVSKYMKKIAEETPSNKATQDDHDQK
ncbi:MAG TPA: AtpZ/AtpI family protein [Candidatus Paceibacterota bacterium]